MDPIMEIARKHKIRVLEDCAQCAGGRYKGKYVGTIGDIGINSFQLSKTITSGEGGAVTTNDPELFERAMRFHDVGAVRSPYAEALGGGMLAAFAACNFRMNEFTGAVLKAQLTKLETICRRVRANFPQGSRGHRRPARAQAPQDARPRRGFGRGCVHRVRHRRKARQFPACHCGPKGIGASGPGGSAILPTDERIEKKSRFIRDGRRSHSPRGRRFSTAARAVRARSTFSIAPAA